LNRPVPARRESPRTRSRAQLATLLALKTLFVVDLLGWDTVAAVEAYAKRTAPKSAIEGIWKVASFEQDGREVSDSDRGKLVRWQWLTIDKIGQAVFCHLWFADGSAASGLVTEKHGNVLTFPGPGRPQTWTFHLTGHDELAVSGVMSGIPTAIQLRRNESWASLVQHHTHWIQEAPREP